MELCSVCSQFPEKAQRWGLVNINLALLYVGLTLKDAFKHAWLM